jgi:hypothetical protein
MISRQDKEASIFARGDSDADDRDGTLLGPHNNMTGTGSRTLGETDCDPHRQHDNEAKSY